MNQALDFALRLLEMITSFALNIKGNVLSCISIAPALLKSHLCLHIQRFLDRLVT